MTCAHPLKKIGLSVVFNRSPSEMNESYSGVVFEYQKELLTLKLLYTFSQVFVGKRFLEA